MTGQGAAEEEEEDVGDFEGINEDTDEEYVPVAEPTSPAPSTSSTQKRKTQTKTNKNTKGEATEEDFKKDSVECPICNKSFKSKYYLKVHNRYKVSPSFLGISFEGTATN